MHHTPDGWEHVSPAAPYEKLIKRDAVTVPKQSRREPFDRDAVIVLTDEKVGVVKGPGARQTWSVADPEPYARELAAAIDAWIDEGGDPYGGSDLNERLTEAIATTLADAPEVEQ